MDLVSLPFSVFVMMVCLPGPAQLSSSVISCPCADIPQWSLTKSPTQTCVQTGSRFRYQCVDGYLRKVGTSNLIKCQATGGAPHWTVPTPKLECIPDPRITTTTTQQTMTTGKTASTTQMTQQSTAPEEGNVTETTTHAETMNQTAGKMETMQSSTPSPMFANSISPPISQKEPLKTTTVATISTLIPVSVCSLGIIFLLYRRKSKRRIQVPTDDTGDHLEKE